MTAYTVLVVDQQDTFITFCSTHLEPEGFMLHTASKSSEAQSLIQEAPVDLALLDINNLDLLRHFRAEALRIPTILTVETEAVMVEQVAEATQLGAVGFLEKPCEAETLLEHIQRVLQHHLNGVRGSLRDMSLTSLITVNCNEGLNASLTLWHQNQQARLFFERGEIVHAQLDGQVGEDVVYEVLTWDNAVFVLRSGELSETHTIHTNWSGLVMEGLRRLDEQSFDQEQITDPLPPAAPGDDAEFALSPQPVEMPVEGLPPKQRSTFELDSETHTRLEERLGELYHELGRVRCLLFVHHSGRLLYMQGNLERSRALSLAALTAGSFSAIGEFAEILAQPGEESKFHQSLQESPAFSFYLARVEPNWILALAFEPQYLNLGLVRQLTVRTAEELKAILAEAVAVEDAPRQEVADTLDDAFRQEVSSVLGDLFG